MAEEIKEEIKQQPQSKPIVAAEWLGKILIALLAWLAVKIYDKVNDLKENQPVIMLRMENLEKKVERMENKVFTDDRFQYPWNQPAPMKKEEEITLPPRKKKEE